LEGKAIGKLVNIDGLLLNPAANDKVVPFNDQRSNNHEVRVYLRSGEKHEFGIGVEHLTQILKERPCLEFFESSLPLVPVSL